MISETSTRIMHLVPFAAAQHNAENQCFVLAGDATAGPIHRILPTAGVLPERSASPPSLQLTIVHINDLHGHAARFTPQGVRPVFSRMVGHLRQLRAAAANQPQAGVLALSAGDDCVGSPFDLLLNEEGDATCGADLTHAAYRLYSAAGLDACALGNHDLDWGERLLAGALRADAHFPLLSANLTGCADLAGRCFPAAIFIVRGVRVAVIGLTTAAQRTMPPGSALRITNPLTALNNLLPALAEISDLRIVLSHLGYTLTTADAGLADVGDVELARALPAGAVHMIIGGHTHHALNEHGLDPVNVVNGAPIVQAGNAGDFVGQVEITVERGCAAVAATRLIPTRRLPVDEFFEAEHVKPLARRALAIMGKELGRVEKAAAVSTPVLRAGWAAGESALCNFVTDALVERCRRAGFAVDFAAIDGSSISAGLRCGRLTVGAWRAATPYADTIRLCTLSGAHLQRLLEENSRRAAHLGEAYDGYHFLHFSREVRYAVRPGASPAETTLVNATVGGAPLAVQIERSFTLAYTSFMAGLTRFIQQEALAWRETGLFVRGATTAHLREYGGVTAAGGARFDGRFVVEEELRTPIARM